jgi:hypothetical protein
VRAHERAGEADPAGVANSPRDVLNRKIGAGEQARGAGEADRFQTFHWRVAGCLDPIDRSRSG